MSHNDRIAHIIFEIIDEVNEQYPNDKRLGKSVDTVLFGKSGKLDSLGLVNFVVTVERRIQIEFEMNINLADEMSNPEGPLINLGTLFDYIADKLKEIDPWSR